MSTYNFTDIITGNPEIYKIKTDLYDQDNQNYFPVIKLYTTTNLTTSDIVRMDIPDTYAYNIFNTYNINTVAHTYINNSSSMFTCSSGKIRFIRDQTDYCGVQISDSNFFQIQSVALNYGSSSVQGTMFYGIVLESPNGNVFIAGGIQNFSVVTPPAENNKTSGVFITDGTNIGSFQSYLYCTDNNLSATKILMNGENPYDPDDPFNGADPSSSNGGGGNFNYTSDNDDIPDLPTGTVADSGFVTLFAPTNAQLKALGAYLWSDAFSLETFKKMFNNPMDCILGLSLVPVNLPHGSAREITVGNLVTTVSCDVCTTQYVYVDCGSVTVSSKSFTGSYLDFSPYTQISLYLPFIGTQPLDADEVMGATLNVVYHVDVLTGAMCCYVKITNTNPVSKKSATHVLYTFMGQCCESVPLSANSWSDTIGSILNAAASIGGVVATAATGGAAAPVAVGMLAGATTSTANAMQSMKPTVNHSGSMGGGGGMMAQRTPKLIMKAPNISKPSKQQNYTGYPVNQTKKISSCKGFTIVQAINLSVSGATQSELQEIDALLRNGVIV